VILTVTAGEPPTSIKEQELQPPQLRKEKRPHSKNPARGNISSIPPSEEHCWNTRRKKLKTPTTWTQGIKTLTKNNSRCVNLNTE
jgi:hypothetical protein